jgi:Tfp pilus assembly protein PilV
MERAAERVRERIHSEAGFGLVEALIAAIILAFGLLAVAGLSMTTAGHERLARWQTDQAMAAQLALAQAYRRDFDSLSSGSADIDVGEQTYRITLTVTDISARVKQVDATVSAVGPLDSKTFSTRLYAPRQLPSPK